MRCVFICSYPNGVIAVSPVFFLSFGSLLIIPGTPSRCYISICMWFMDIRVWRNPSTHLVHVKMSALSQRQSSWSQLSCLRCDQGEEAGQGFSPVHLHTHQPGVFLYSSGESADNAMESLDGLGSKGPLKSLFKHCLCLCCTLLLWQRRLSWKDYAESNHETKLTTFVFFS